MMLWWTFPVLRCWPSLKPKLILNSPVASRIASPYESRSGFSILRENTRERTIERENSSRRSEHCERGNGEGGGEGGRA